MDVFLLRQWDCQIQEKSTSVIFSFLEAFHVPNFALGHNGLITFSIFIRGCQIDVKGQIIAKEENY